MCFFPLDVNVQSNSCRILLHRVIVFYLVFSKILKFSRVSLQVNADGLVVNLKKWVRVLGQTADRGQKRKRTQMQRVAGLVLRE